jgi:hypothetical protein
MTRRDAGGRSSSVGRENHAKCIILHGWGTPWSYCD